ncbi:MAG: hypothetical protein IAF38_17990, partial [Bacteroidia bacterium]|nr:hypothetical protein [Bacteroidia bacterium]
LVSSLAFCIAVVFIPFTFLQKNADSVKGFSSFSPLFKNCFFVLFISFSVFSMLRNKEWKNRLSIISSDIEQMPNSAKANELAGDVFIDLASKEDSMKLRKICCEKAIVYYERSIVSYAGNEEVFNKLGSVFYNQRADYRSAIAMFDRALKLKSDFPVCRANKAMALFRGGDTLLAEKEFRFIMENQKIQEPMIFNYFAELLMNSGRVEESVSVLKSASEKFPESEIPLLGLSNAYFKKKDTLSAVLELENVLDYSPNYPKVADLLFKYYSLKKDSKKAERCMTYLKSGNY